MCGLFDIPFPKELEINKHRVDRQSNKSLAFISQEAGKVLRQAWHWVGLGDNTFFFSLSPFFLFPLSHLMTLSVVLAMS